jgi:predicted acetyltransferase
VTALIRPDAALFEGWRQTVDEFGDDTIHGSGFWHLDDAARRAMSTEEFDELVTQLHSLADHATRLPEDRVHCHYLWITDGSEQEPGHLVGFLALRHALTPWLLEQGGHIGYSVRPSRRREGHASRALGLAVRRSAALGLDRVLVTCDEGNRPSARTIERNGGVYENNHESTRRYWIDTGSGR